MIATMTRTSVLASALLAIHGSALATQRDMRPVSGKCWDGPPELYYAYSPETRSCTISCALELGSVVKTTTIAGDIIGESGCRLECNQALADQCPQPEEPDQDPLPAPPWPPMPAPGTPPPVL
jgi:hypothetical protein